MVSVWRGEMILFFFPGGALGVCFHFRFVGIPFAAGITSLSISFFRAKHFAQWAFPGGFTAGTGLPVPETVRLLFQLGRRFNVGRVFFLFFRERNWKYLEFAGIPAFLCVVSGPVWGRLPEKVGAAFLGPGQVQPSIFALWVFWLFFFYVYFFPGS